MYINSLIIYNDSNIFPIKWISKIIKPYSISMLYFLTYIQAASNMQITEPVERIFLYFRVLWQAYFHGYQNHKKKKGGENDKDSGHVKLKSFEFTSSFIQK